MASDLGPSFFKALDPPESLAPFVRRILITHNNEPVDLVVQPAPTGYNYLGWIYAGHAECRIGDTRVAIRPGTLHYAGQIQSERISIRYRGYYGHVIAETTATGFYRLTRVPGIAVRDQGGNFDSEAHPWSEAFLQQAMEFTEDATAEDRFAFFVEAIEALVPMACDAPAFIADAAALMEQEHGLIQVSEVAERLGVGRRHLTREFSRVVGLTPKAFQLAMQVNRAIALWRSDEKSALTRLAQEAGFYDQAHFNRTFRRYFNSTPSQVFGEPAKIVFDFLGASPAERGGESDQ